MGAESVHGKHGEGRFVSFEFKRAVRENVGLLIGLAGGTGSGKTYTAMRLAAGIAGDRPFAVIDTEAGRAKHYADYFNFDHGEIQAPFRPDTYIEAIEAADKAGYPAIVVDSMSHVWAGNGGVLDWQEQELQRMAGSDWKKREQVKMAAWIAPKMAHKRMVQRLLQVRAHLILCFRAEEKIDIIKDENGKTKIVPKQSQTGYAGWIPICEKSLPFEMTASFMLIAAEPGIPKPIKLQRQHMDIFPLDKPVTEDSGRRVAQWAAGANPARTVNTKSVIDRFAELGIKEEEVVKEVGVELDKWTDADLAKARRVYTDKRNQLTKDKGLGNESP
jgi:hypothetical protein